MHHVELDSQNLRLFDTLWFVLVSVSTVGYGDISPVHFSGKLFVMLFIVLGFVVILPQVEELYEALQMQRRVHNSVSYTDSRKHVILCSTELRPMIIRDFLTEFFSDPKNIVSLPSSFDLPPFVTASLSLSLLPSPRKPTVS